MEKYQIIPVGQFLPYTLDDLSVVIPQASQYVRRIKWFIPQYIKGTSDKVLQNTVVVYDPEDNETKAVLKQYGIRGITTSPPHTPYKFTAGFNSVKTRLCVRMHNDTHINRNDWAEVLIEQFNKEKHPQLVGAFNISGTIDKERLEKFNNFYPCFDLIYKQLIFSEGERSSTGAPFLSAHLMASQSYVFKGIYPLITEFNDGKMDKEDVLTTLFMSIFGIKIIHWTNMYQFVPIGSKAYGDFDEGEIPPTDLHMVNDSNRINFPKAEFKEIIDGQR